MNRLMRFTVGALLCAACAACDSDRPQNQNSTKPPPANTAATRPGDVDAVRDLVGANKPAAPNLPAGHPPLSGAGTAPGGAAPPAATAGGAAAGAGELTYTAPESWTAQPPTSPMRKAQWKLPVVEGDPDDANLVLTFLTGSAGGVDANLDRWQSQFTTAEGQPLPAAAVTRSKREVNGLQVATAEMVGRFTDAMTGRTAATTGDYRLLGAVVTTPGGVYFFKAIGPDKSMQAQRAEFEKLISSLGLKQ